jgi:hypothetical protein
MVDGEPFACAPKTGHDLIRDEQYAIAIAQRPHTLQIALGRDDDPVGAGDRFEQHRGDGLRTFVQDDFFQVIEVILAKLCLRNICIGAVEGRAVAVGIQKMDHPRHQVGLPVQPARVAGQGHCPGSGAVVGAVASQDLMFAGVGAGQLDGVFVGICSTQGEQEAVQARRCDL